jgi:hypothetical protein
MHLGIVLRGSRFRGRGVQMLCNIYILMDASKKSLGGHTAGYGRVGRSHD